ncbi:type III-A CRISPR-associated RAMP protein Csm4 [Coleofasciculus sp.]|uniref:type III-A CRISPR-associated RAMP protein Csm4 n=1 Tax=Coleofasciculus sp. TaxID=3100458 RepID=UPI003A29E48A
MSLWKLVRINFGRHPVHFGEVGIGIEETAERIRSDTLFSAWITAYVRLFGTDAVEDLLAEFRASPPVRMSSTFIYQQLGEMVLYYLPRPLIHPRNYPTGDDLGFAKMYKKLEYLPLNIWQRWYQGEGFTEGDRVELEATANSGQGGVPGDLHEARTFEYGKTYQKHKLPKLAIDRLTHATNFYHTGLVKFEQAPDYSGLYFLLKFRTENPELENRLYAAFQLLGETGIGGERSSGAGLFQVDCWSDLPPDWQQVVSFQEENSYCLMSLFWQSSFASELSHELENHSYYEFRERGGWICSPFSGQQLRRKNVKMFIEGSVFPFVPGGELADVTPARFKSHQVYRNGIGLSLPIK